MEIAIRSYDNADVGFIFNSWLKSFRESPTVRRVPNSVYYENHHSLIDTILASSRSQLLVACNPEDANEIYGYVVAEYFEERTVVHWVYCKQKFRQKGVARQLMGKILEGAEEGLPIFYTHYTKAVDREIHNKAGAIIYDPYILWLR